MNDYNLSVYNVLLNFDEGYFGQSLIKARTRRAEPEYESELSELFQKLFNHADKLYECSRIICGIFYSVGFGLITYTAVESFCKVIRYTIH